MYLIAEYCAGPFYMGWWLYLRDSKGRQQRNADGDWGWIRYSPPQHDWDEREGVDRHPCRAVFDALGFTGSLRGGRGDKSEIAKFAFAHRIPRQRIGGKPRGCVEVTVGDGVISLAEVSIAKLTKRPCPERTHLQP